LKLVITGGAKVQGPAEYRSRGGQVSGEVLVKEAEVDDDVE
jgi:hypothetical protein